MGAGLIVLGGLNSWQVPAVAIAGPVVGFGLVGLVSIAGKEGGTPGVAPFRAALDQRGNLLPGAPIRIARWGREAVNAVTGTYAAAVAAVATWAAGPGGGPAPHRRGVALRPIHRRLDRAPRAGLDGHDRRLRRAVHPAAATRRTGPRKRAPE